MVKDRNILIKNIYYMLSYVYRGLRHDCYKKIDPEQFNHIHDLFAEILSKGVSALLKRGLNMEYIETGDSISVIRGKINIGETIRQKVKNSNKLFCTFDEFSENHYMNRILKTTLNALILYGDLQKDIKVNLKKLCVFFSSINTLAPSSIKWDALIYNKSNYSYKMLMDICYLVLSGLLLSSSDGACRLASFIDDRKMHNLFEKFILEYYRRHFKKYSPAPREIRWHTEGFDKYLPKMHSDITLVYENKVLIIDAKYYGKMMQHYYGSETVHSSNIYQIFSYVQNYAENSASSVGGMLLYARTDENCTPDFDYIICGNSIKVKTLDLNKPFEDIKMQLDMYAAVLDSV